jgi:ketosteroid isomerase-like protein
MDHAALMRRYYETYNSEDADALRQFYAEDVVLSSAQGELYGPDGILGVYRHLISQFHDRMTPEAITIAGNTAEVEISDRFTAKVDVADFMGVALKAGESLELSLRGSYEIVDGKFRRIAIAMR